MEASGSMTMSPQLAAALKEIRSPVEQILSDGENPSDILSLGILIRRYAPEQINLIALCEALEQSTLSAVVTDVAYTLTDGSEDDDAAEDDDADDDDEDDDPQPNRAGDS
jgi:hypothetical protein